MSKFNLKLAGQYSNNLSRLINDLLVNPYSEKEENLFKIEEVHQKSKIKVGKDSLDFEDETIKKERSGRFANITLEQRLKLIKDLSLERLKINTVIAQKVNESKIKSAFTGEEVTVDLAKQENVLVKQSLLPSFDYVSGLVDSKTQGFGTQEVAAGDSISNVRYPVETTKTLDVDRKFVETEKMELLRKLDEQSMEIDKVKTISEFEFENAYDVRETINSLVLKLEEKK